MIKDIFFFKQYNELFQKESQSTEESKPVTYEIGDIVNYQTNKYDTSKKENEQPDGAIATGEIKKVIRDGKRYRIYNKNIDDDFTKSKEQIIGKDQSKKDGETEKKDDSEIVIGKEELLEKIYSEKVYKFGKL